MKKIVVIGGGTMGLDIAQVFAQKGFDVVVRDINSSIIRVSETRLNKALDKLVAKGKLDEAGKEALLSRLTFTVSRSRSTDFTLPGPSGVWTKDSCFGIRFWASS